MQSSIHVQRHLADSHPFCFCEEFIPNNVSCRYNRSYVAVHTDQGKATPGSTKAYIYLHNLEDPSLRIEHVLGLDVNGNVMHNVVDNLLIIHHQVSAVRDHVCLNHSTNRVAVSSLSAAAAALGSIVHCLTCISGLFLPCHFFFFFERAPL
eukprot:m.151255 g.151255  ORF g.151255 m.151255 type:complete len:151 (+) comp14247_c0_seq4:47-499(+)